jgi:cytoskeletal protein CcmA (bactofilin family)
MAKASTTITAGTLVRGRISGAEDIDLFGRVEGQIEIDGVLKIDGNARADAEITASDIYVYGILIGNATATDTIHLTESALVVGDLTAPRIIIDSGARVKGQVEMTGQGSGQQSRPTPRRAPAPTAPPSMSAPRDHDEDDEPDLPSAAAKKKVAVKKRS